MRLRHAFFLGILLPLTSCAALATLQPEPPMNSVSGERIALVDLTALGGVHVTNEELLQRDVPLPADTSTSYAGYFWSRFASKLSEATRFGTVDFDRPEAGSALTETRVMATGYTPFSATYCGRTPQGIYPTTTFPLPQRGQPIALEGGKADLVVLVRRLSVERAEVRVEGHIPMNPNLPSSGCREPDGIALEVEALVWDNRRGVPILAGPVIMIAPGERGRVGQTAWEEAVDGVVELMIRYARLAPRS